MVINPRVEMMTTEEKVELILQRFRKNLRWALEKSSFYKKKYNGLDIHAEDLQRFKLEQEGVVFVEGRVNLKTFQWQP